MYWRVGFSTASRTCDCLVLCGWEIMGPFSRPVISSSLGRLRNIWLASDLQQLSTGSKLSSHRYSYAEPPSSMPEYKEG